VEGLFKRRNIPILPGDRIHEIFGKDVEDFEGGLDEIKGLMKTELRIWLKFERMDGEPSESEEELLMLEGGQEYSSDEEELLMITNGNPEDQSETVREGSADNVDGDDGTDDNSIRPGQDLRIFRYKKKPKLNGTVVRVRKLEGQGVWQVELVTHPMRKIDEGSRISIEQEYLRPLF
jgi:hypothetical protein